ncbi:MAG: P1 family peptidase [Cytophagales bacterium]|nr:P1 family peptidase [Cytophagales bacterium]
MSQDQPGIRDLGIKTGILNTGKLNAITDVPGVMVGHTTLIRGEHVRTGVTAILPHEGNIFQQKVPAAIFIANGFGKLAGYSQVNELGNIETPIILTNTLSVGDAVRSVVKYVLDQPGNENVRSVNAVVGETNDGYLNDIRGMHVEEAHIWQAIKNASGGPVLQGNAGAGTGTVCFGYKGGIGTSSRVVPEELGGYTVGVLVQTNFGGVLEIAGVPVGVELGNYPFKNNLRHSSDGSCMIVVMTDAPLKERNLKRLAKRAMLGLGKTGGIVSNGSGDYVIAVSTHKALRIPYQSGGHTLESTELKNDAVTPLFLAAIEATEEAILNSLFATQSMEGYQGRKVEALPVERVMEILKDYGRGGN